MQETAEDFLRNSGLLFQINRAIMHPLGLSLSLEIEERPDGTTCSFQIHETEEPTGFVFPEAEMLKSLPKYTDFLSQRRQRVLTRAKKLGFIVQEK